MGRKAKYFDDYTVQPFIDVILADLGLTDKIQSLVFKLGTYTSMNGDIDYSSIPVTDGKWSWCTIRANRKQERRDILGTLAHECRHLWQYYHGYLKDDVGNLRQWKGKLVVDVRWNEDHEAYMKLPWEKDAFAYENEVDRLFPNGEIPTKQYVGTAGNVKFYKVKG